MLARIALVCCALLLAPLARGQGNTPDINPQISLDFGGGTLSQFVEAVKKAAAQTAQNAAVNVVFAEPKVAQFQVPPVQLRLVSVESALRAAVHPRARAEGNERPMLEQVGTGGGTSAPVFVVSMATAGGRPPSARVEVFDLRDLISSGIKPESVLTAVQTGLEMDEAGARTNVKFHPDSGLLIVRGDPEALDTVRQVAFHLREGLKSRTDERGAEERHKKIVMITRELDDLYARWSQAKAEVMLAREAVSVAEADLMGPQPKPDARKHIADAHAKLIQIELASDRLEQEVRSREHLLQQLRAQEIMGEEGGELSRLRQQNAELKTRIGELEKKAR